MTIIVLILILIPIALIIATVKSKGKVRGAFLGLLTIVILTPIILLLLLKPAREGKILPGWGKLSLLMAEPVDLWIPLAEAPLQTNQSEYYFKYSHKYVGRHNIQIIFSNSDLDVWKIEKDDLTLTLEIIDSGNVVFKKETKDAFRFKGLRGNGLSYIKYSASNDLPVGVELDAKVTVKGDIGNFVQKFGSAKLVIKKGSDL